MKRDIHKKLHTMTNEEIAKVAHEYLVELLHKRSVSFVCESTHMNRRTVYNWIDEDLPLESISRSAGVHFILMCETAPGIVHALDSAPTTTAYFEREDARTQKRHTQ